MGGWVVVVVVEGGGGVFDNFITSVNIPWGVSKVMMFPFGSCILKTLLYLGRIKHNKCILSFLNVILPWKFMITLFHDSITLGKELL